MISNHRNHNRLSVIALLTGLLFSPFSELQAQEDNWPCAQILVPAVSAAVVWPYVIDEEVSQRWRTNQGVMPLAMEIANQFRAGDDEAVQIAQFLNSSDTATRPEIATDLFLASLHEFNTKRQKYIQGIQKFTSKQKALATRLSKLLDLRDENPQESDLPTELVEQISVLEQIFFNRESILLDMCEHPVRVEENLGFVARTIAGYVE